jgi:hypothetical protein
MKPGGFKIEHFRELKWNPIFDNNIFEFNLTIDGETKNENCISPFKELIAFNFKYLL